MEATLLQFLAATANGTTVHIRHGLKERGIELNRVFRFGKREFRNRGIKLKLKALQENRVEDVALGALPAQNAVAENKFNTLRFAVDAAVKRIEGLKEAHRLARGLLRASPLVAKGRPAAKSCQSCRVRRELNCQLFPVSLGLFAGFSNQSKVRGIIPAAFQPRNNLFGRLGRRG